MRWWVALSHAMRTWHAGRIGRPESDRLVAGGPVDPRHTGLAALLDAVATAPFPEELSGERTAVDGFVRVARGSVPTSKPVRRRRAGVPLSIRAVAVKVAAGVAVLVAGGTAVAAETGHLPAGVQQRAHNMFAGLGVPRPGRPAPAGTVTATGDPSTAARPGPLLTPSPGADALALCRAWQAARTDKTAPAMTPDALRVLAAAAGGTQAIPGFCGKLLAGTHGKSTTTTSPTPATTHGHSGGGHPHNTPSPHH